MNKASRRSLAFSSSRFLTLLALTNPKFDSYLPIDRATKSNNEVPQWFRLASPKEGLNRNRVEPCNQYAENSNNRGTPNPATIIL